MRFIATDGWRALPGAPSTAAGYVQDAAGVKRSEAYRIVSTARVINVLATYVEAADSSDEDELFRWILDDVIGSTHTGEWLTSNLTDVISTLDTLLAQGTDAREAIAQTVAAHPRPSKEPTPPPGPQQPDQGTGGALTASAASGEETAEAKDASMDELLRAERILVCPHCGEHLR